MTIEYRKNTHTIFRIEVHLVWVTKYRYKVLTGDIAERTRELVRRIYEENKAQILSGVVSANHVHILLSIDPSISSQKTVLGTTTLGMRILCGLCRECEWTNGERLHRAPFWWNRGGCLQDCIADFQSASQFCRLTVGSGLRKLLMFFCGGTCRLLSHSKLLHC